MRVEILKRREHEGLFLWPAFLKGQSLIIGINITLQTKQKLDNQTHRKCHRDLER